MDRLFVPIEREVQKLFSSEATGHDFSHLQRVFKLALKLHKKEGGNRTVIGASALVHDVHRLIQAKTGRFCSPKDSLPEVRRVLKKAKFPMELIPNVLHCVEFHEEYGFTKKGKTVTDIETLILQDADNLDAIGAVGIARAFTFGATHKVPFWLPQNPAVRQDFDESEKDPSTIHHFYSKLLKLKDNFSTKTAKKMALKRHKFMKAYLEQFLAEWEGKA